ncbi:MAG: alpha/beta hydrolase-fold protein [Gemmatimonadales bacterium]
MTSSAPQSRPHALARAALVAMLGAFAGSASAQPRHEVPSLGVRVSLHSDVLDEERELWIWTPAGYSASGPAMPVVFLLDPETHFRHATAVVDFLARYLRMPEAIVVGVLTPSRARDFTPASGDGSATSGGAAPFLRFLTEEAAPLVERTHRASGFRILVGHSLGGLFATYAAFREPSAFGAVVALSPSLYWADSLALRSARSALSGGGPLPRFLYVGMGEREQPRIAATTRALVASLAGADTTRLSWTSREFEGENHLTVPLPALRHALAWLFADWPFSIDGVADRIARGGTLAPLDEHFTRLSARYGYAAEPAELAFSMVGDRLYRGRHFELAIELFARRVAAYPESPEAHDELARGYEAAGRLDLAVASFDRAWTLARAQSHPSLGAIAERRDRARAALEPR